MSIALNVITGFLGSGKTTLLKRLLQGESLSDLITALLINEFGDVGIDHLLVGRSRARHRAAAQRLHLLLDPWRTQGRVARPVAAPRAWRRYPRSNA